MRARADAALGTCGSCPRATAATALIRIAAEGTTIAGWWCVAKKPRKPAPPPPTANLGDQARDLSPASSAPFMPGPRERELTVTGRCKAAVMPSRFAVGWWRRCERWADRGVCCAVDDGVCTGGATGRSSGSGSGTGATPAESSAWPSVPQPARAASGEGGGGGWVASPCLTIISLELCPQTGAGAAGGETLCLPPCGGGGCGCRPPAATPSRVFSVGANGGTSHGKWGRVG